MSPLTDHAASVQVRCTDIEDYARIYNEGFSESQRQCEADVRTAGADALKEAAAEQRRLAADARTDVGQAEHEDIADWLEERADEMPGRRLHCPLGCDEGACETCPCCSAGFCVYGLDGLPDDPEDVGAWLEVAAEHNPVAALLAAQARPSPTQEQIAQAALGGIRFNLPVDAFGQANRLDDYTAIWANAAAIKVLALLNGADSPTV